MATAEQPPAESTTRFAGSETFDLFCERGILAIVVAALVYAVLAFGGVRTQDFVIIQGLTILGLILWAVRMWAKPRFRLLWPPISWAVVAFVIYAIVRCVTDSLHYPARHELSQILTYAGLFFLASNNLTRRNSATVVSMALVCVGFAVAGLGIYQFATHHGRIWGMYKPPIFLARASGTFVNPNHLAGFLELILPLTVAYTFMGRLSIIVKVLLAYSAMMMGAAICMSLSRGGMLATVVTMCAVFIALLFQRDFWLKAVLSVVLVGALIGGALTQTGTIERRFGKLYSDSGKIEDTRMPIWDAARKIYSAAPVLGPGPGHFDYEFRKYAPPKVSAPAQYAHNDYLNALCDWGAIGLAMLLVCCALLYRGVMRTWPFVRRQPNQIGSMQSNKGAFVFGAAFSLFAILLHSFTDFNLHIPSNAAIAVVLAGLLTAHWRFATESFWLNPRLVGKIAVTLAIGAICFYVGKEALRDREEAMWLARAEQIQNYGTEKQAALAHAWKAAPDNFKTAYDIGECLRLQSWAGEKGYQQLAQDAMSWFDRAMALNPFDPYSPMRFGMCLDWIDKRNEAQKYFDKAQQLCPNDFLVLTYLAWHQMQLDNWKEADRLLRRSLDQFYSETAMAYLELTERRLAEPSRLKP